MRGKKGGRLYACGGRSGHLLLCVCYGVAVRGRESERARGRTDIDHVTKGKKKKESFKGS
jgi:hypothetical protein